MRQTIGQSASLSNGLAVVFTLLEKVQRLSFLLGRPIYDQ